MKNGLNSEIYEAILDNYVALWRHIIGDKRLRVDGKVPTNREIPPRNCRCCGSEFIPKEEKDKYKKICGSKQLRTGCAWRGALNGSRLAVFNRKNNEKKNNKIWGSGNWAGGRASYNSLD